jgi:hypothetical protein
MLVLVRTKGAEFLKELEADDPYDLMNPKMRKWDKVSISMNLVVGITCYRSPEACKYKWQTLLLKYKRIADLHKET